MTDHGHEQDIPASDRVPLGTSGFVAFSPEPRTRLETRPIPSPTSILVSCVLARTLGPKLMRRMKSPKAPLLLCVNVPDKAWLDAVRGASRSMCRVPEIHVWDSTARRTPGDPSVGEVVSQVTSGRAVLCMSQDVATAVPRAIRTVADATVTLSAPEPADIAFAIGLVRGGRAPSRVPLDLGRGLELLEVAACLRPGDAPRLMVDRIRRAMASKPTLDVDLTAPRLEDLHGYGKAAVWGRRVVADVAAFRAGRLDWRDVTGPAVLHGPPGTGKTLFSRALARSLDAPLFATSVSSWFQNGTGDLGATIRGATAVFDEARAAARGCGVAVLFLDEVDGLPNRPALDAREGSWWRPVVNHVLTLVDGAASDLRGIVLVGATNDISAVDRALLRPGRFGNSLEVPPPSVDDLAGVVRHHLGGRTCPLTQAEVTAVLRPLAGATQARAAAWAAEAARRGRDEGRPVRLDDLIAVVLPTDGRSKAERRRIAIHEAGHAVVAWQLARDRLVSVSIVETANHHGSTTMVVRDDAMLVRDEIDDEVVLALGGRAADVIVGDGANAGAGGGILEGASSDLFIATRMLTAVQATYGLGPTLRHRGRVTHPCDDDEVARLVEADLQRLMRRAEAIVSERALAVAAVADALLERGFLSAPDVNAIVGAAEARAIIADV